MDATLNLKVKCRTYLNATVGMTPKAANKISAALNVGISEHRNLKKKWSTTRKVTATVKFPNERVIVLKQESGKKCIRGLYYISDIK